VEDLVSLSDNVKEWALEAGFDLAGIAGVEPLPEAERSAKEWLSAGMAAGMKWITEGRIDLSYAPSLLLSSARSVITLGKYYLPPKEDGASIAAGPRGKIARYAQGQDYHDVFPPRMASFVDRLARELGHRPSTRFFVDSSPLAEKPVAVRSGIAFYGKNGCMLTRGYGSWILLAEIMTDLELEPDMPMRRDCGRCRICMDRCPTGAIAAPYKVDARLCISYLTIEHKGPIPLELRGKMGNWIFGCDVCQDVCPYNQAARPMDDPAFMPRAGVGPNPALIPLLRLDRQQFKDLFKGSPILRPKRRGFLRNVAVALGNSRDPSAVPALAGALQDEEPLVRSHSAWALGQMCDREAKTALEVALHRETDEAIQEEIRLALDANCL
jgi:epoxyqueuosine reductase